MDAIEAARTAAKRAAAAQRRADAARMARDNAILDCARAGIRPNTIADALRISPSLVRKIVDAAARCEETL